MASFTQSVTKTIQWRGYFFSTFIKIYMNLYFVSLETILRLLALEWLQDILHLHVKMQDN